MRLIDDSLGYYYVENNILKHSNTKLEADYLSAYEIMSSWIEVKDDK